MDGRIWLLVSCLAFASGCGQKAPEAEEIAAPSTPATAAGPATNARAAAPRAVLDEADLAATQDALTQTLRKFSAEKRRVPKSLNELVSAGELPALPAAPTGKKWVINTRRVEVILEDQ